MNDPDSPSATVQSAAPRLSLSKIIKWLVAALLLATLIGFGIHYWRLSKLYVSTDNAYVNANRIEIAAQVAGPVTRVWVRDQQTVKRGEVLFEIDPQPYQ